MPKEIIVGATRELDETEEYKRFPVNYVKIPEQEDFEYVRDLCDGSTNWNIAYDKKSIKVWTKVTMDLKLQMLKARAVFPDVTAATVYDVLHDSAYRKKWDKHVVMTDEIGYIDQNNDVCYYAVGKIPPLKNRDFVLQRSWLDAGNEKYICSHSVCHNKYPPQKGYIRGIVYLNVYFLRKMGNGCQITYLNHSDPKGKLPTWMMNRLTKTVGPKMFKNIHKACMNYAEWKEQNQPDFKPWLYPEQQAIQHRVDLDDCMPQEYEDDAVYDESSLLATNDDVSDDED